MEVKLQKMYIQNVPEPQLSQCGQMKFGATSLCYYGLRKHFKNVPEKHATF